MEQSLLKYKHQKNIHEHEKRTTNGSRKYLLNLWQRLHLRSSDKHAALLYYTRKNIRKQYKNTKLTKIIAPTWDDECELPDGSYSASDIQDYKV